ncbi:MAG: HypC/HybG/HupF family hydrogenase formation chaperone [Sphingobacteriales bacterium]|nr:HypC/HybG/HupF family hydrogenase formation chaperone [Sphingobacteriales bacterium]
MCLSIPAKVIEIEGNMAKVSIGGTEYRASLELVENVGIGDYVLVHTGFAIQKLAEDEAIETLRLFEEFEDLNKKLDEEEKEFRNPSNPGT